MYFCNQKMMDNRRKKTIVWLLIAAYLPMLLASGLHVHHQPVAAEEDCYDCLHNIAHPVHFSACHDVAPDCLYCHLLSLPELANTVVAAVAMLLVVVRMGAPTMAMAVCRRHGQAHLRAPPSCL
ncbi:MAG: hypothetical protein IJ745_07420 [Bacteroidales bacterium]|nr:hypothetical protein [Bacteroidales bacterium]